MTARILLVTEDPYFIQEANAVLSWSGAKVTSCLGPAHTECELDRRGRCPLAARADMTLVDSPAGGRFRYHTADVGAGEYAERLQRAHPRDHVVLCGAPEGCAGPTGEVATVTTHREALYVLTRLLRSQRKESKLAQQGGAR